MSNEVVLKVEYIVDRDDMTDDEYQAQEEKVFFVTQEMIMLLVEEYADFNPGEYLCGQNFFITKP
jgi:hypothetical protein